MRGYYNLSKNEIAFLCAMFTEVKFNRLNATTPITPERLAFMKDKFVSGCLNAVLNNPKQKLEEKAVKMANSILEKNSLNETMIEDFKTDD